MSSAPQGRFLASSSTGVAAIEAEPGQPFRGGNRSRLNRGGWFTRPVLGGTVSISGISDMSFALTRRDGPGSRGRDHPRGPVRGESEQGPRAAILAGNPGRAPSGSAAATAARCFPSPPPWASAMPPLPVSHLRSLRRSPVAKRGVRNPEWGETRSGMPRFPVRFRLQDNVLKDETPERVRVGQPVKSRASRPQGDSQELSLRAAPGRFTRHRTIS